MFRFIICMLIITMSAFTARVCATAAPNQVATIVVHGFSPGGASTTGTVGLDETVPHIADFASTLGLPMSVDAPLAANQVAYTEYYGDTYPAYYSAEDIQEVDDITAMSGGGVPRYALIVAKYADEVMKRSGALQVNLFSESFGSLITRYIIENDVEQLASSGKIARWMSVSGVVDGHYAISNYGVDFVKPFVEGYYGSTVDLEDMKYTWVKDNISTPSEHDTTSCPFYANFPTHFYKSADDDFKNRALTRLTGKANDGIVPFLDMELYIPAQLQYLGLPPTESVTHTTHLETQDYTGIRAGIAAQLFSRKRVTIKLEDIRARKEFDGGVRGQGEYVFGLKVFSPKAETDYNITKPIHNVSAGDNSFPFVRMAQDTTQTINLKWFDDMVLPGETQLRLETNVQEVDYSYIYNVNEAAGSVDNDVLEDLENTTMTVSTVTPAEYVLETPDWRAKIRVDVTTYPAFSAPGTAAKSWSLYE